MVIGHWPFVRHLTFDIRHFPHGVCCVAVSACLAVNQEVRVRLPSDTPSTSVLLGEPAASKTALRGSTPRARARNQFKVPSSRFKVVSSRWCSGLHWTLRRSRSWFESRSGYSIKDEVRRTKDESAKSLEVRPSYLLLRPYFVLGVCRMRTRPREGRRPGSIPGEDTEKVRRTKDKGQRTNQSDPCVSSFVLTPSYLIGRWSQTARRLPAKQSEVGSTPTGVFCKRGLASSDQRRARSANLAVIGACSTLGYEPAASAVAQRIEHQAHTLEVTGSTPVHVG